jgi:hypothetical protein
LAPNRGRPHWLFGFDGAFVLFGWTVCSSVLVVGTVALLPVPIGEPTSRLHFLTLHSVSFGAQPQATRISGFHYSFNTRRNS